MFNNVTTTLNKYKIPLLISGLFLLIVAAVLTVTLKPKTEKLEQPQAQPTERAPQTIPLQSTKKKPNPLIDQEDLNKVKDDFNKKLKEKGFPTSGNKKYNFQYQLAPLLKRKQSKRFFFNKNVLAATNCNLDTAPKKVTVYALKAHWSQSDAQNKAKEFGITSPPYSLPADGGTFQYFFSEATTSGFLALYESSGTYTFHKVIKTLASPISLSEAKSKAKTELKKHNLTTNIIEKDSQNSGDFYFFSYEKLLDDFKLIDQNSIESLGDKEVCDVTPSSEMNSINIYLKKDGQIAKFINNTREVAKTYLLPRSSLEESIEEYKDNLPVDPIVLPKGATGGEVTIDEATLVYYELGQAYPQTLYVPLYLTSGKTTSGSRVLTLFPAVSTGALSKTGLTTTSAKDRGQKQGTFTLKPPKPPYLGGCPGNQVDYAVRCTKSGTTVCAAFIPVKPDDDPYGICDSGCQSKEEVIDNALGENPCKKMLENHNIPTDHYTPASGPIRSGGGGSFPAGPVSCTIDACPC